MRITVTELDSPPSMFALSGACQNRDVEAEIASNLQSSYFATSDRYRDRYRSFMSTFVEPIKRANRIVDYVSKRTECIDVIRPIICEEDLRNIPPKMMLPLLTHKPMWNLLREEKIQGWGFTAEELEHQREIYHLLLDVDGVCELTPEKTDRNGEAYCFEVQILEPGMPDFTLQNRLDIDESRDYVDEILRNTDLDPTDLDSLIG